MFEANLKFSDGSRRESYDRVATVREKSGKTNVSQDQGIL